MFKFSLLVSALLSISPVLAQDAGDLVDAAQVVPSDFTKIYDDATLGEIWGKAGAAREEARFCVRDGKVECVLFGLSLERLMHKDSYYNFYGLKGLPPVTNVEVLFHPKDGSTPTDGYDLVLQFTGSAP
jgi:hypothetical protein